VDSYLDIIRFNFLYVDKYSFGRTWVYPESTIPYCMLRYIIDGKAEFCVDGETYIVEKDQIAYLPEGCNLLCRALVDNFSFISIRFTTSVYYEGANFLTEYFGFPRAIDGDETVKKYFYEIYNRALTDRNTKIFRIRGYLELIIAHIIEKNSDNKDYTESKRKRNRGDGVYSLEEIKRRTKKSNVKDDPRIRVVYDYILAHPTEQYTSEKLSNMADLSETTFRRLFKKQTGKAPMDFLRDIRLTTSARKLLMSNSQVSTIAYEVGFEDPNYFIRVFKKAFGMTPYQYRKTARE